MPDKSLPVGLVCLVCFNLVPLYGVFAWNWHSFDLIFLYWMENVVIGLFSLARMIIRPYTHPLEMVFPMFLAPFFALHYGGFSWGHGVFVVGLFGPEHLNSFALWATAWEVLTTQNMAMALLALVVVQLMDWVRDVRRSGLGADSVLELMVKPYRRIVVLHLTIIGAGFALDAMDEPTVGLLLLVLLKTASDVWHWRKDAGTQRGEIILTPAQLHKMHELYPQPVVTVNGEERKFASFAELKKSKEFRMATALMRIVGAGEDLKAVQTYMEMKVKEEKNEVDNGLSTST